MPLVSAGTFIELFSRGTPFAAFCGASGLFFRLSGGGASTVRRGLWPTLHRRGQGRGMAGPVRRTRDRTSTPGRPDRSRPNPACQPTPPGTPTSGLAVDPTLLTHPPDPVGSRTEPCRVDRLTLSVPEPDTFPRRVQLLLNASQAHPPEVPGSSVPARAKRRGQRFTPGVRRRQARANTARLQRRRDEAHSKRLRLEGRGGRHGVRNDPDAGSRGAEPFVSKAGGLAV